MKNNCFRVFGLLLSAMVSLAAVAHQPPALPEPAPSASTGPEVISTEFELTWADGNRDRWTSTNAPGKSGNAAYRAESGVSTLQVWTNPGSVKDHVAIELSVQGQMPAAAKGGKVETIAHATMDVLLENCYLEKAQACELRHKGQLVVSVRRKG